MEFENKGKTRIRRVFLKTEDELLKKLILSQTITNWNYISEFLPGRTARQCRERWKNYLSPTLNQKEWNKEEDDLLIDLIQQHGLKWSKIQTFFENRSYSNIKNRYYSNLKNKIKKDNPIIQFNENDFESLKKIEIE